VTKFQPQVFVFLSTWLLIIIINGFTVHKGNYNQKYLRIDKKRSGYCYSSQMHLSRAIVPAEKLWLFSRKNEDKKVTQVGFEPTHSYLQGSSGCEGGCYPQAYWSSQQIPLVLNM